MNHMVTRKFPQFDSGLVTVNSSLDRPRGDLLQADPNVVAELIVEVSECGEVIGVPEVGEAGAVFCLAGAHGRAPAHPIAVVLL